METKSTSGLSSLINEKTNTKTNYYFKYAKYDENVCWIMKIFFLFSLSQFFRQILA
jgi:hypothetical protein